jgi:hypothetical protein
MCRVFRRLDWRFGVDAVFVANNRLGSVQAGLHFAGAKPNEQTGVASGAMWQRTGKRAERQKKRGGAKVTCIKFFPSGFVTNGCSLGVVNV